MTFVPAWSRVGEPDAPRLAFVLHGILGSGRNWRSLARRLVAAHPDWQIVLVDLRHHGASGPAPPPQTLAACADDVRRLVEVVGVPHTLIGHSFGGKVALECGRLEPFADVVTWVLDAPPGPVQGEPTDASQDALGVLAALRAVPVPAADRAALRSGLAQQGLPAPIVAWLLTSTRQLDDGRWTWVFDLDAIRAMLQDYFHTDQWPLLRASQREVHLVRAGRGDRWSARELDALQTLPPNTHVRLHVLPEAGHWVHVDDPDGTFALLATTFT